MIRVPLRFNEEETALLDKRVTAEETTRYSYCMKLVRSNLFGSHEKQVDPPKKKKVEKKKNSIWIEKFILKEAAFRAKQRSLSTSSYIAGLVQANVTKTTVFRHKELEAVLEANRQLAAIGRNLNQIARHLNDRYTETDRLKLDHLNDLKKAIESQRSDIYELVKASRRSWGIEDE